MRKFRWTWNDEVVAKNVSLYNIVRCALVLTISSSTLLNVGFNVCRWDDCRGNPDIYCEVSGSCLQPTVTQVKWNQNQDTIADFGTVYVEANSNFCHDSTWNGCGPTYIPDFLTDIASDVTNFRNSCNQHDVCYQNCSVSREQCEIDFILNMYAECQGYYLCLFLANLFYAAVFHGGEPHCIENRTDLSCTPAEISSCGI